MTPIDSTSRHRDALLLRRLLHAVLTGGTMSEHTRRAVLRGLTKAACVAEPDSAPSAPPTTVSVNFAAPCTINIYQAGATELARPHDPE